VDSDYDLLALTEGPVTQRWFKGSVTLSMTQRWSMARARDFVRTLAGIAKGAT